MNRSPDVERGHDAAGLGRINVLQPHVGDLTKSDSEPSAAVWAGDVRDGF
jgi:hypothetical protein